MIPTDVQNWFHSHQLDKSVASRDAFSIPHTWWSNERNKKKLYDWAIHAQLNEKLIRAAAVNANTKAANARAKAAEALAITLGTVEANAVKTAAEEAETVADDVNNMLRIAHNLTNNLPPMGPVWYLSQAVQPSTEALVGLATLGGGYKALRYRRRKLAECDATRRAQNRRGARSSSLTATRPTEKAVEEMVE